MQEDNQKAIDNALFKKLEDLTIRMPSDPILYKTDVDKYLQMFKVEFEKVQGDTMKKSERFGELLIFLARSVKFFPEVLGWIPGAIMRLMEELGPSLHSYIRKKCAGSIMILRAKNILLPVSTIEFLMKQMRLQDKQLRSMIYKYLLNDIRRMNSHHQNNKINQQIRAFISGYLPKHTDKTAQKCLKLLIELYKRNVWTDNRTVNIIAEACFAPASRSRLMACHFLMETTMPLEQLPDSDDEVNPAEIKSKKGITKNTKYKQKLLEKEKRKAARRSRKRQIESRNTNFMPIDLLYNAQVFVEKLFNIMNSKNEKYAHKLMYMGLIARVIWRHQLILLPFYRSLIKYLDPKQKDVHLVLAALAESVHQVIPEDEIETLVKHIIEHFVNDRCSEFTMTIGLNTLREIFKKLPSIITEEMMLYLCTYYEYRNKNVSRAAKSVINFVREYNPALLEKKFRGNDMHNRTQEEGEKSGILTRIPGVELLLGDNGEIPMEIDRILTDEDFKKIRRLVKKKEEEQQRSNIYDNQIPSDGESENEQSSQEVENEEIDDDQVEELEIEEEGQDEGESEQVQQQEGQDQDQEQEQEESQESQIDWDGEQEIQFEEEPKTIQKTKQIKKPEKGKNAKPTAKQESQVSDDDEEDDQVESYNQNPHGFINTGSIAYYKMSKGELKAEKKQIKEGKEKFKHTPKQKKGGSTNREKQKFKPLMMTRAKKNKIRSNEKQLKTKIKHLKNQLGKVRSGKEAKKLKNKKIVKKPKIK